MESFSDKTRAFFYSLAVHLSVFALLFVGLFFYQPVHPVATPGPLIEAEIVGTAAAPRPQPISKPKPEPPKPVAPPPAPEPPKPDQIRPPEVKPPPTVQRNDNKEQEKIAELERTEDALGLASGMAAISSSVLTFVQPGGVPLRFYRFAWRYRNATASVTVEGFGRKVRLADALVLVRRQQQLIAQP